MPTVRPRFPRITAAQVADLEDRIYDVGAALNNTAVIPGWFIEPRLLARLKARSLKSLNQPQYRAACLFLAEDLALARRCARHLRPAVLAWRELGIGQPIHPHNAGL